MKFANIYIFLVDGGELTIKAYKYEFIAQICFDFSNAQYKFMTKNTDTMFARELTRNAMKVFKKE